MRSNKSVDTSPEKVVRSLLHRAGFRFRKHMRVKVGNVSIKTDLVFSKHRVAVFVDGCFWHGCRRHCRVPKSNRTYWNAKINGNSDRDRRNTELLTSAGWKVIRGWEHDPSEEIAVNVVEALIEGPHES